MPSLIRTAARAGVFALAVVCSAGIAAQTVEFFSPQGTVKGVRQAGACL